MLNRLIAVGQKFNPETRKIAFNAVWLSFDRIFRMVTALFVGVWVARYLGPSQFGLLSFATAFVGLFSPLVSLNMSSIVIREIVQNPNDRNTILGTSFLLKLITSTAGLVVALLAIIGLRSQEPLTWMLVGIVATAGVFQSLNVIDLWFQSQVQSKFTIWATSFAYITITILKIGMLSLRAPLIAFALLVLVEAILGMIGLVIIYRSRGFSFRAWRWRKERAQQLLKDSWPMVLAGFAVVIYMRIDQVMLGQMVGEEAVGVYSAAVRISEMWYFVPGAIVSSTFPSIVKLRQTDQRMYDRRIQNLFTLMALVTYLVAVPMIFLSGPIIALLFGNQYEQAAPILLVHIWSGLFVLFGVAQEPWNISENLMKLSLRRTAVGAVINVVLNLILIPLYSGMGAAIATVIAYASANFLSNALDRRTRPIFYSQLNSIFLGVFR